MELNRLLLKQQARGLLQSARPSVLTAGAIYVALGAVISFLSSRLVGISYETMERYARFVSQGNLDYALSVLSSARPSTGAWLINLSLQLAITIVGAGFTLFILNTVRGTGAALENLLDGFAIFWRVLLLNLVEGFFILLWGLLLVVPGIIAAYRYSMALYVLLDHPEYGIMDCLRESKAITAGHKMELFKLDLSFLGWGLLTAAPYVGYLVSVFVTPYYAITHAFYYERLSGHVAQPEYR
jgi:uncharacterized membrane protein